ncbi:MAG: ATP-dependent helicase [Propionibacteriaceae bacterium]|jgi:superfamily I DNA/RNA helicase|nr:ATP-dependent helicase [Propionibacteriaceae bacterium]
MINANDWHAADDMILESSADEAIRERECNVVVTAGPGSGKTELLAQRADFLLRTGACPYPMRILAISFKTDAAKNLRDRVRRRCGNDLAGRLDSYTFHAFAKHLIDNYRLVLTPEHALSPMYTIDPERRILHQQITFNDLVPLGIEVLERSSYALNGLRQTYSHVFLDEFQDATRCQYELVKRAFLDSPAVLTAVGDTMQRIMSWAGALDGILKTFATDFNARDDLILRQNYRSDPVLRRMQNRMIKAMAPSSAVPADAIPGTAGRVDVMRFSNDDEEAQTVAVQVQRWTQEGTPPKEIAVLVRQQPAIVAAKVVAELFRLGIATRDEASLQDLTAEPVAALILDLLRVLVANRQAGPYQRLLSAVTRAGFDDESTQRFESSIRRFLYDQRAKAQARMSAMTYPDWKGIVDEFLKLVTKPTVVALSVTYQQGSRLQDVIDETLTALADHLRIDNDIRLALKKLSGDDSVRILTIHKSKGLEFGKVIILGVERQLFWHKDQKGREETSSTFFVGISRAKHDLLLTVAESRMRPVDFTKSWDIKRTPHEEFLAYAKEPPF